MKGNTLRLRGLSPPTAPETQKREEHERLERHERTGKLWLDGRPGGLVPSIRRPEQCACADRTRDQALERAPIGAVFMATETILAVFRVDRPPGLYHPVRPKYKSHNRFPAARAGRQPRSDCPP